MYEKENTSQNLTSIFTKKIETSFIKKNSQFFSISLGIRMIKDSFDRYNSNKKYNMRLFEEVNRMIKYEDYKYFPQQIESGYILTKKQREAVNAHLNKQLDYSSTNHLLFVEKYLKLGFELDSVTKEKYLYNMLINDKIYNVDNLFSLNIISETDKPLIVTHYTWDQESKQLLDKQDIKLEAFTESLRNYIKSSDFYNTQLHNLVKAAKTSKKKKHYLYTEPYKHLLTIFSHENKEVVLKNMPYKKFMSFVDELNLVFNENVLKSEIRNIINDYYKNGAEHTDVKPLIKPLMKPTVKENLMPINNKVTEHIVIENLPEVPQNIIKEITELYNNIKSNDIEDFDIDNLFEKRLPEVLDKYFKIAEKYRNKLKNNEGNTAEDLLIESLENIRSNFDKKWEDINMQALSSLSATNKYTRTFK